MSFDFEDIVKQGYLKVKSKNLGKWNKRWVILKRASSKGEKRLEKYTDEKASLLQKEDPNPIFFTNVKTISRLPNDIKKHAFAVVFNDNSSRQYASDSDFDADDWFSQLSKQCSTGTLPGPNIDVIRNGVQSDDCFNVYLLPSPNLDLYGECIFQVTAEHINLWDVMNPSKKLVAWPLTSLRRYGKDESKFTLEAGRHCDTGQGLFVFNTIQGSKLYSKVHSASVAIAEAHRIVNKQNEQTSPHSKQSVLRVNSDVPKYSAGTVLHASVKPLASDPGERAPLPLPRTVSGISSTRSASLTTNISNLSLGSSSTDPFGEVFDAGDYETALLKRPLPPTPTAEASASSHTPYANTSVTAKIKPSASIDNKNGTLNLNNNNISSEEFIYEEKYLEPEFKKFLAKRKMDK